jgi:hypothetical protein
MTGRPMTADDIFLWKGRTSYVAVKLDNGSWLCISACGHGCEIDAIDCCLCQPSTGTAGSARKLYPCRFCRTRQELSTTGN